MESDINKTLLRYFREDQIEGNKVSLFYLDINEEIPIDFFLYAEYSKSNEIRGRITCSYDLKGKKGEILLMTLNLNKQFSYDYEEFYKNAMLLENTPFDMKKLASIKIPDEQSNIWTYFPALQHTIYTGGNPLYHKFLYPPNDTFFALYVNCVVKNRIQDIEPELPEFIRQITKGSKR